MAKRTTVIAFEAVEFDKTKFEVARSNPNFFKHEGVQNRYAQVYAPSYPHIVEAYEAAGKVVYQAPVAVQEGVQEAVSTPEAPVEDVEQDVEPSNEAEADWRDLGWPQLRSKATAFTEDPIKSKQQAIEILEQAEQDGLI